MANAKNRRRPPNFREVPTEDAHLGDRQRVATERQRQCRQRQCRQRQCRQRRVYDARQDHVFRFASNVEDEVDVMEVSVVSERLQHFLMHDLEQC
jgi:hypothetical protein